MILLTVLAAGSLAAQPPKQADRSVRTVLPPSSSESIIVTKPAQPNVIAGRKVVYSGIIVQAIKTKEPMQLINPFAPAEYGSGSQNMERDVISGKPTGNFKLFSVSF